MLIMAFCIIQDLSPDRTQTSLEDINDGNISRSLNGRGISAVIKGNNQEKPLEEDSCIPMEVSASNFKCVPSRDSL